MWFEILISLIALTLLEIVLGIDNIVLLAVLTEKLPSLERKKARYWGLTFAWVTRLLLLASAVWIVKLKHPIIFLYTWSFSFRDLFMLIGGLFLLYKATEEIHQEILPKSSATSKIKSMKKQFWSVVMQIGLLDIIFSLDSVLTAVGLTDQFWVMAVAITMAILIMLFASERVGRLIEAYPTLKMLALCFLILIGMVLIADGFSFHVPRGYIYFSMVFAIGFETLNILNRKKS